MRSLAIFVALAACNGFSPRDQPGDGAQPIANAGTGSFYPRGTTVTLDGSRSFDPDGTIATYAWEIADRPGGSTSAPADPGAMTTTFVLDQYGTYTVRLHVTDDHGSSDSSDLRLVSTGAIQTIDAGDPASVAWLDTVQVVGTVGVVPGHTATYRWSFIQRPPDSTAVLEDATLRAAHFVADATGTYVLAFDVTVGDEVREDTVAVEATASGVTVGPGAAYAYISRTDRVLLVHDVGHGELVSVDPATGATTAVDLGSIVPRSLAVDDFEQSIAVGGTGQVATVAVTPTGLLFVAAKNAPGCTAKYVTLPFGNFVDCYPDNGTADPITAVDMTTGNLNPGTCPAAEPFISPSGNIMLDGASSDVYFLDATSTPPGHVAAHLTIPGIAPPLSGSRYVISGNGFWIDGSGVRFDFQMPVTVSATNSVGNEIAIASDHQIRVYSYQAAQPTLVWSAAVPTMNGTSSTTKLIAYSSDNHRLIIVASTGAGDVAFTVPR